MIKVIVVGACGRMGNAIARRVVESEDMTLAGATEKKGHPSIGKDVGEILGLEKLNVSIAGGLEKVVSEGDVVIDFTAPSATLEHLKIAVENGKAMVIGTTGFSDAELAKVKELAAKIPCVISPNMSVGVNLLFKLVGEITETLGEDYDVEIVETHHRLKKDAPSGTALKLAARIAKARKEKLEDIATYGRKGKVGERKKGELGIHAVRTGDVVGEHIVTWGTEGERVELVHRAHARDTFAQGALRAAKFVVSTEIGVYSMEDILGLI